MPQTMMSHTQALRLAARALRADASKAPPPLREEWNEAAAIIESMVRADEAEAAAAAEAADRRADAEARLAELAADGEVFEAEDRVAAGAGSRGDFARVVGDAIEGERFRIASAACDALASMILGGIDLPEADRAAIVQATRADWTARDRS